MFRPGNYFEGLRLPGFKLSGKQPATTFGKLITEGDVRRSFHGDIIFTKRFYTILETVFE